MNNAYLKDGRLADVLALIQVLAHGKWPKRWHGGIVELLKRDPISATTWVKVGTEHPEFFRVLPADDSSNGQPNVALIMRMLQRSLPPEKAGEPNRLKKLTPEQGQKLMDLAVTLHDRALQRKDRWKTAGIPIAASIISAAAIVVAAFMNFSKPSGAAPTVNVNPQIVVPEPKTLPAPAQEQPRLSAPKDSSEGN